MSRGKSKTLKVAALDLNLTRTDIEALIADVADWQREAAWQKSDADRRKAEIDRQLGERNAQLETSINAKWAIVKAWAEKHRATICAPGTKTAIFATGEISWRLSPKSVGLKAEKAVVATLKRLGLQDLIRVKETVDKQAILKAPERVAAIQGITISQQEEIALKPNQSAIEPVELIAKVAA